MAHNTLEEDAMNEHVVTIRNLEDYLGYASALLRIQAIQREHIRRQVEEFGQPRDEMTEAKAWLEERGE